MRLFVALPLGAEGIRDLDGYRRDLEKRGVEPGLLLLDRLDTFGKGEVLGLCPGDDTPVRPLAAAVERSLRDAGFALEKRRFRAHVTLCRELRAPEGTQLPPPPAVAVPVEEMVLFLSHRPGGKLTYTPLWRKKLRRDRG